jgi:hypothetical protein
MHDVQLTVSVCPRLAHQMEELQRTLMKNDDVEQTLRGDSLFAENSLDSSMMDLQQQSICSAQSGSSAMSQPVSKDVRSSPSVQSPSPAHTLGSYPSDSAFVGGHSLFLSSAVVSAFSSSVTKHHSVSREPSKTAVAFHSTEAQRPQWPPFLLLAAVTHDDIAVALEEGRHLFALERRGQEGSVLSNGGGRGPPASMAHQASRQPSKREVSGHQRVPRRPSRQRVAGGRSSRGLTL